ncbi:hypothetical protein ACFE04_013546 [Oxalis oulophora]
MKWEMAILSPETNTPVTNWLIDETNKSSSTTKWTAAENKLFENALAIHDKESPDRWHKIAAMIPGKTVGDVIRQYKELEVDVNNIEAGLIPIPGYSSTTPSPFNLEYNFDGYRECNYSFKRSSTGRHGDQERKKGVPWTEEEHKLFLMGLNKYGKGDWRNISRNFVVTRTPTQVASHAQKYFIRQLSGGKDKRRASIHDITTVNLNDTRTPSPDHKRPSTPRDDQSSVVLPQHSSATASHVQWNQPHSGSTMVFNSMQGNMFNGLDSYGFKLQGRQNCIAAPQSSGFQMQSSRNRPH